MSSTQLQSKTIMLGKHSLEMLVDSDCELCNGKGVQWVEETGMRFGRAPGYTYPIRDFKLSHSYVCEACIDKNPPRAVEEFCECPFCGSDVDSDISFCCGEVGHGETVYRFTEGFWAGEEATREDYIKHMRDIGQEPKSELL